MRRLLFTVVLCVFVCSGASASGEHAVTILVEADHAPYAYEHRGELRGISVDLLQAVFRNTPYRLDLAVPTAEQLSALRAHGEFGVAGFYPLPSDNGRYVRSDMVFTMTHCLYTRKGFPRVTVANASQNKIGVRSESYLTELAGSHLGVDSYVSYATVQEGVEMLLNRKFDVLFEEEAAIAGALDALGANDQVQLAQSTLYQTPVHIVLPADMAAYIDEINIRIAQVRASGMASLLLNTQEEQADIIPAGGMAVPLVWIGIMCILFVIGIIIARSILLAPMRTLEALSEAFPTLALGDSEEITYINGPARELMNDLKLAAGKRFAPNERLENARTGLKIELATLESEPDVLLIKDEIIIWRGSLDVRRAKLGTQGETNTVLRFSPHSGHQQQRGFALLNVMMGIQDSFTALCQGVFNVLEAQMLATAMGVYMPNGVEGVEPLFETFSSAALRGVFGMLYRTVYEHGLSVLLPEDITELAARCGVRYNDQVRFVAAPLMIDNQVTGMLFLRLRMSNVELSAGEREMLGSVAWRLSLALQRFNQEARTRRFAWYDSNMRLPNAAYFEQLLRSLCGEPVSAPAMIQADFKGLPQAGAAVIFRVSPPEGGVMDAIAEKLHKGWRAARLNDEMFGLLLDETDILALEQRLSALRDELLSGLSVSLYFGAARFPFDALSADGLISLTRLALAKSRQNEIVIHGG